MYHKNIFLTVSLVIFSVKFSNGLIDGSQTNLLFETKVDESVKNNTERSGRALRPQCQGTFNSKCLKIHLLSFIEDLSSREELSLLPGLSIVKEATENLTKPEELAAEVTRQFPGKPDEKLNQYLLLRLQNYLDSHSVKFRMLEPENKKDLSNMVKGDPSVFETGRGKGGGGGGGFGGGKGGGGLLAAALMMKGTLAAAALAALALLAGKALMTALISLLLSALAALKGHGGGGHTTYEVITKPEVSHHHTSSHEEHHEHAHHGHHDGYRRAYNPDPYSYAAPVSSPGS